MIESLVRVAKTANGKGTLGVANGLLALPPS